MKPLFPTAAATGFRPAGMYTPGRGIKHVSHGLYHVLVETGHRALSHNNAFSYCPPQLSALDNLSGRGRPGLVGQHVLTR